MIFENPKLEIYAYKLQGMTGKISQDRQRFSFTCVFRDLRKDSMGRVQSLIIFNDRNECYFETLTIKIEKPKQEVIRIIEEDFDENEKMMSDTELHLLNRPKVPKGEDHPKERPKSKYTQH